MLPIWLPEGFVSSWICLSNSISSRNFSSASSALSWLPLLLALPPFEGWALLSLYTLFVLTAPFDAFVPEAAGIYRTFSCDTEDPSNTFCRANASKRSRNTWIDGLTVEFVSIMTEVSQQFCMSILMVILGWNFSDPGPFDTMISDQVALAAMFAGPPSRFGLDSRDSRLSRGFPCKKESRALRLVIFLLIKYWLFSWPQNEISAFFPRLLQNKNQLQFSIH